MLEATDQGHFKAQEAAYAPAIFGYNNRGLSYIFLRPDMELCRNKRANHENYRKSASPSNHLEQ